MMNKILQAFAENPTEFISGQQLSERLNCSRTAVWKHIENLRKEGYEFEAVSRKGYRLLRKPERLDMAAIMKQMQTKTIGHNLIYIDEIDSTQTKAHQLIAEGAAEGTVVIAELQTRGKGTRGKAWHSPKGKGIWMSIVLKPSIPAQYISQLTLLSAVALCRTINKQLGLNIGVKWPNDLLIDGKKVSGILLESSSEDDRLRYVIAGVGISVNITKNDFPKELHDKATSLQIESGKRVDREQILCAFLLQFEQLYELYLEKGFAPIRSLWEALSVSLNRPIEVHSASGFISGIAKGLDESGALLVTEDDGQVKKIFSGDVLHK